MRPRHLTASVSEIPFVVTLSNDTFLVSLQFSLYKIDLLFAISLSLFSYVG